MNPDPDDSDREESILRAAASEIATQLASAGLGAGVGAGAGGLPGALVGASLPGLITAITHSVRRRQRAKRQARQGTVIAVAARIVGVDPDEVIRRLEADPEREELLTRTLGGARDAASLEKLLAFAMALVTGCDETGSSGLVWETIFVRALGDCDHVHLQALRLFFVPSEPGESPVGSVPDDLREKAFSRSQLASLLPPEVVPLLDAVLSTLERHGILRSSIETRGLTFGLGPSSVSWRTTQFGREFLDRMTFIDQTLRPPVSQSG